MPLYQNDKTYKAFPVDQPVVEEKVYSPRFLQRADINRLATVADYTVLKWTKVADPAPDPPKAG